MRSESIVFFKTREAFGELSNMASRFPLTIDGTTVPSSEALYQACRFPHLPKVQELILDQKSPMTAKMVSKPYRAQSRSDWDDVRVAIMKWCLRVKLLQHWREFGEILLRTGDGPIVEQSSKDPFWGAIADKSGQVLKGTNVLGRLLMELRSSLRKSPADLEIVRPVPIESFYLLGRPIGQMVADRAPPVVVQQIVADGASPSKQQAKKQARAAVAPHQLTLQLAGIAQASPKQSITKARNYHIMANPRGGWDVLREGGKRASAHFATKSDAIARGRELARKQGVELIQHKRESAGDHHASDLQVNWLPY
jgi:ribA/ribD-fused uncharacterized protein